MAAAVPSAAAAATSSGGDARRAWVVSTLANAIAPLEQRVRAMATLRRRRPTRRPHTHGRAALHSLSLPPLIAPVTQQRLHPNQPEHTGRLRGAPRPRRRRRDRRVPRRRLDARPRGERRGRARARRRRRRAAAGAAVQQRRVAARLPLSDRAGQAESGAAARRGRAARRARRGGGGVAGGEVRFGFRARVWGGAAARGGGGGAAAEGLIQAERPIRLLTAPHLLATPLICNQPAPAAVRRLLPDARP